jgi:hypothetical protein
MAKEPRHAKDEEGEEEAATGTNGPSGQVRERTHAKRVEADGETVETPNEASVM